MKKFLSMLLAILLVFSVMAPITVFAENGPNIMDPNDENLTVDSISTITFMYMGDEDMDDEDINILDLTGIIYPVIEGYTVPEIYKGASYDPATNTLTLKNVKVKDATLSIIAMGDDFKINLVGYNELSCIISSAGNRGGSVTITGNGELVVNRTQYFGGIMIHANETASSLTIEETAKVKVYSNPQYELPAIEVYDSTITASSEIIKLGGTVAADAPVFNSYVLDVYEQLEAYDLEWNSYEWYDYGLKKGDTYYVADTEYNENYDETGKYFVFSVAYDDILGCYTATKYADGEAIPLTGFSVLTEYGPIYDENRGYYIGYTDEAEEGADNYKALFAPETKEDFDLCSDADGNKFGFYQVSYSDDDGTSETYTTIYNIINHPVYGYVAVEDKTKTTMDGLTPIKTGEKELAESRYFSDVVINNGGSITEPAKIKNIKATSTNQGAKVTWSADPVADKYRVYRKVSGAKKWTRLDTIDADETSFIDKTATSGKKYIYTVRGVNFVGDGTFNSTGVTHTYYEAPEVSIKTTTKGVYLKWAKIAGATKYRIYRQTSGSSKWSLIDTVTGTSFTDKTAKSGKKYFYRVRSAKGDIMSGYNVVSKYFLSAPKLSSAKNSASGIKVTWKEVNGAEGYNIYRKSGSGSYKYIGKTSKLYYTDTTAKSGTTYTYTVKAYKSKTESSYNSGLSCKYLAAPKVETKLYTSSINLSWDEIRGAKEYVVYRKASGESKYTKLTTTSKLSYKDTNIKNNKTYYYRVKAVNGKTTSSYDTVKQLFLATPKLSSVKNTNTGVEIKWSKVSGATSYRIYRKSGSGDFKLIDKTKKTTFTDDSAKSGTVYTYTVKACNENAISYYNKTGLKLRYVKTTGLYSADNAANGVQLRWSPADKADKYYVYRKLDGESSFKQIDVVSADELKKDQYGVYLYIDKTAKNGQVYFYDIKVSYKGTLSGFSSTVGRPITHMAPIDVTSATATSDGIKIKWEKSAYATAYRILRREKGAENYEYYSYVDNGKTTTALDQNVESGKTYEYAVIAIHDENNGKGGWSAIGGSKSVKAK